MGLFSKEAVSFWQQAPYSMFAMEMVKRKDRPRDLGPYEFSGYDKITGLMLCMLMSYFGAGKYIILIQVSVF